MDVPVLRLALISLIAIGCSAAGDRVSPQTPPPDLPVYPVWTTALATVLEPLSQLVIHPTHYLT